MRQTDLDILLHEGEGSMLEYKESFSSSLAREIVAFANGAGGKIILGVRDDGFLTATFRPCTAQVPHKYRASHPACNPASRGGALTGSSRGEIANQVKNVSGKAVERGVGMPVGFGLPGVRDPLVR